MKQLLLAAFCAPLLLLAATLPASAAPAKTETAIFAGGCFWCMEHDMKMPGVLKVESGYTGGHLKNPRYEDVLTEKTGHYEAVRVTFDPAKLPYRFLLERYWKVVDPTDDGGQFCDRGPSYRPAVFVTPGQRAEAEASRAEAAKRLKRGTMKAPILNVAPFYLAEAYHRDYAKNNKVRYELYRAGCGRDARLSAVWGR